MRLIAGLFLMLAFALQVAAQTEADLEDLAIDDDFAAFQELLEILDEQTTVATKTKLNSDYVPGMVTVLQGADLEAMGIATVWEALSLVPGMQIFRNNLGEPFVVVRGLPFPFNSGNIKILTNSVAMSRETSAINTSALLMPVEQVERIEVVRGPGSSVYGNFAFMGLVNIITRKEDQRVFASVANGDHYASGVQFAAGSGDLRLHVNLAGWTSDKGEGSADQSADEERLNAVGSVDYRNTSVAFQLFDREYISARSVEERNRALDLRHHADFSDSWYADFSANYLDTDSDVPGRIFKGDLIQAEVDLGWKAERMDWLFALSGTDANIDLGTLNAPGRPQDSAEVRDSGWEA